MSCMGFYVWEHPKAQPAVVPALKRLRRQGHSFKSYPKHTGRAGNQTQDSWSFNYLEEYICIHIYKI